MYRKFYAPKYEAWCILCRWHTPISPGSVRTGKFEKEWETHYRFFHNPATLTGHKPNGHSHYTIHGYVQDCVCGGSIDENGCSYRNIFGGDL